MFLHMVSMDCFSRSVAHKMSSLATSCKMFLFFSMFFQLHFFLNNCVQNSAFYLSNFLEEISLSRSVVFLYFFTLISEEGFLISPCYSLELCIQMGISFLFSFSFSFSSFSAICKASSDNHFAFLHFFSMGMVLITAFYKMSWTSIHSSSGTVYQI